MISSGSVRENSIVDVSMDEGNYILKMEYGEIKNEQKYEFYFKKRENEEMLTRWVLQTLF